MFSCFRILFTMILAFEEFPVKSFLNVEKWSWLIYICFLKGKIALIFMNVKQTKNHRFFYCVNFEIDFMPL